MKNISFFILLLLGCCSSHIAIAQACTANQNMGSAIIDPPKLPFALAGQHYSATFSFRVPADTSISGTPVHVNSTQLIYIGGIPYGFGFQCNPASCIFNGGTIGCAALSGDPVDSQIRSYPIIIYTKTYYTLAGTTLNRIDSNSDYVFKINPLSSGTAEIVLREASPMKIFPNPSKGHVSIEINNAGAYTLDVYDITGKLVFSKDAVAQNYTENIQLSLEGNPAGLYTVLLRSAQGQALGKLRLE